MNIIRACAAAVLLTLFALPAFAAESDKAKPNPAADTDTAKKAAIRTEIKAGATPIAVQLEGTDTLGARLSLQLKEIFNGGTLFFLSAKEEPKILLILHTVPEFPSRPGVGSAYSATWVYYERATAFTSYLAGEAGVISPDAVDDLAARLAERSSGIAAKYAYIFNK